MKSLSGLFLAGSVGFSGVLGGCGKTSTYHSKFLDDDIKVVERNIGEADEIRITTIYGRSGVKVVATDIRPLSTEVDVSLDYIDYINPDYEGNWPDSLINHVTFRSIDNIN